MRECAGHSWRAGSINEVDEALGSVLTATGGEPRAEDLAARTAAQQTAGPGVSQTASGS